MCWGAPGPLYLVRDGRPVSTIVYPDNPDCWTFDAAKWVCAYVRKSTGAYLRFVSESRAPDGTLISVGHTRLAKAAGIDVADLKWDGHKMLVKGDVLFLLGRHEELVNGTGALGTNRAAIAFLEQFCGVRWFLPTPEGELVPKCKDISVPRDLEVSFSPAFAFCDGRWPYRSGRPASFAHYYRMSIRRGHNTAHTWPLWTPAAEYFNAHPEYFAVIGSRRSRGRHRCTTNPELKRALLRAMRRRFDAGCDMLRLGQEDGYQPCQCPECESTDNYRMGPYLWQGGEGKRYVYETLRQHPCERVLLLQKWLIDRCRESHPDKLIQLLVYWPTLWPSRLFDRFGDNVIADICMPMEPRVVEAWRGKVLIWGGIPSPVIEAPVPEREFEIWIGRMLDIIGDDRRIIFGIGDQATGPTLAERVRYVSRALGRGDA